VAKIQLAFWLVGFVCPAASADVGVVLNESLDEDVDRISSTGHSAIYFSRICPESPVKLRLCGPGEYGSVMSNYLNIGEDQPLEWNIVPLNIYLYGVEDPRSRPLFASYKIKHLLEERYRGKYLKQYCASVACIHQQKNRMARNGSGYFDPRRLHFCREHHPGAGPATHRGIQ
jgi:hypothetical protein